jgi:hypothetical protein
MSEAPAGMPALPVKNPAAASPYREERANQDIDSSGRSLPFGRKRAKYLPDGTSWFAADAVARTSARS